MVRDRLTELIPDVEFAAGLEVRDRPERSGTRSRVKYALGRGLGDERFDASVLSKFRTRGVEHSLEERCWSCIRR